MSAADPSTAPTPVAKPAPDGPLLAMLVAGGYGLWTLLPNSNGWMVGWPWVALWQGAVMLPLVWLLWQGWYQPQGRLGLSKGWTVGFLGAIAVCGLSTLTATFPHAARWQLIPTLGTLAAAVALQGWLRTPSPGGQRRWRQLAYMQGGLAITVAAISLGLWIPQTYWLEQQHLADLAARGIQRTFSFDLLEVRNWYPLGHQNYVAGYLVLNLPLLAGLAGISRGRWRGLWLGGGLLALLDLYTTGSRAGTLGLLGSGIVAAVLTAACRPWPWHRWLVGLGGLVGLSGLALGLNARLVRSLPALLRGNSGGGELAYRWITTITGWRMGLAHPWTGLGPGSVPFAYQGYRPPWAGREAELIHQLHNTPIQLWAELGLGGIGLGFGAIALLLALAWGWLQGIRQAGIPLAQGDRTPPPLLVGGLWAGLAGYGLVSVTDYQLDNIAISGSLVVFLTLLWQIRHPSSPGPGLTTLPQGAEPAEPLDRSPGDTVTCDTAAIPAVPPAPRWRRRLVLGGMGVLAAMVLWLIPVHRAWSLSSDGFVALSKGDIGRFQDRLSRAQALVPQDPYYPYQLGWNLGELSRQGDRDAAEAEALRRAAIVAFNTANALLPQWEFGHSNLGWLRGQRDPQAAVADFAAALQLVPAKPGLAFGLALHLLQAQQPDLALPWLGLEALRHPAFLTSALWQQPGFRDLYPAVQTQVLAQWSAWLNQTAIEPSWANHIHRVRGSLHWWRGDWAAAAADWQAIQYRPGLALLTLAATGTVAPQDLPPGNPVALTIQAWLDPDQRSPLLTQAWAAAPMAASSFAEALIPPQVLTVLGDGMAQADSFLDWLQTQVPSLSERNTRLGFGVLIRHIDGPPPVDYGVQLKNLATTTILQELFPSPTFLPALDDALGSLQAAAISALPPPP
ncbi:MAG: O-antigen ligase family protein, partial [Cyanobacteria bacterium]|nr:O-antigen ligase family protein [Cyanobacteriota bacterium]